MLSPDSPFDRASPTPPANGAAASPPAAAPLDLPARISRRAGWLVLLGVSAGGLCLLWMALRTLIAAVL